MCPSTDINRAAPAVVEGTLYISWSKQLCSRGGNRGGKAPRAPKKDVSAMDLDADMDAYMASDVRVFGIY